jgi:transposase
MRFARLYLLIHDKQQIATILVRANGKSVSYSLPRRRQITKTHQDQRKKTIIESLPHEVGFTAKFNWTLQLIGAYIKRACGESYSIRGVSKLMHRLDMSYTKPTYTLVAADEEKQKEFVETTFPRLKKLRSRRNGSCLKMKP